MGPKDEAVDAQFRLTNLVDADLPLGLTPGHCRNFDVVGVGAGGEVIATTNEAMDLSMRRRKTVQRKKLALRADTNFGKTTPIQYSQPHRDVVFFPKDFRR